MLSIPLMDFRPADIPASAVGFFDFVANKYYVRGRSAYDAELAIAKGLISFTRASTKSYTDSAGVVASVASGKLARGNLGALIEPSRTNTMLQSQFASGWTISAGDTAMTLNATTAPDGSNTGTRLNVGSGTGNKQQYQNGSAATLNPANSVYFKQGTARWASIAFDDRGTGDGCFFDLQNGVLGTAAAGVTGTIQALGNGWYRCAITKTLASAAHFCTLEVHNADAQGIAWTSAGTENVYAWGAQQEASTNATSYIPTTTAAVTRSVDALTLLVPAGTYTVTVVFDDNSIQTLTAQTVSGTAGWAVPTNLNRALIRSIMVR